MVADVSDISVRLCKDSKMCLMHSSVGKSLCSVYQCWCLVLGLDRLTNALCVALHPGRCGQKRLRNVAVCVCVCFPPWAFDDSRSDTGVAGMEELDCLCS